MNAVVQTKIKITRAIGTLVALYGQEAVFECLGRAVDMQSSAAQSVEAEKAMAEVAQRLDEQLKTAIAVASKHELPPLDHACEVLADYFEENGDEA